MRPRGIIGKGILTRLLYCSHFVVCVLSCLYKQSLMYSEGILYDSKCKDKELFSGLEEWDRIANAAQMSRIALAHRWTAYHSML